MQRALTACLLALIASGTTAGCSQSSDPSASAPSSTSAEVCTSVGELQASVADLQDVPVAQQGVGALQDAFAAVRSDVTQVVQDAQSEYRSQSEGLTADVAAVQTAVGLAQADPTGATVKAVVDSIKVLADDVGALAGDISSTC
jgi:hypothetical protein